MIGGVRRQMVAGGRKFAIVAPMQKFIFFMAVLLVVFIALAVFKDRWSR